MANINRRSLLALAGAAAAVPLLPASTAAASSVLPALPPRYDLLADAFPTFNDLEVSYSAAIERALRLNGQQLLALVPKVYGHAD